MIGCCGGVFGESVFDTPPTDITVRKSTSSLPKSLHESSQDISIVKK